MILEIEWGSLRWPLKYQNPTYENHITYNPIPRDLENQPDLKQINPNLKPVQEISNLTQIFTIRT